MTRNATARVAGATFLLYIAIGITQMVMGGAITSGADTAAKLVSVAAHATRLRIDVLLDFLVSLVALALAVALYGITREEDQELATFALVCRIGEGLLGAFSIPASLSLLWLATGSAGTGDAAGSYAVAAWLMKVRSFIPLVAAILFAVGSTIFSSLLLRGRMIPVALAWLGVASSVLLLVLLPAQLIGMLQGSVTQWIWLPMAVFEISLALWFLLKGVRPPARLSPA
jgi:hypothetical protein